MSEELLIEQQDLGQQIEKVITNYHKDGPARKTLVYLEKRASILSELWEKFITNHEKLIKLEADLQDHPYFINKYQELVQAGYEQLSSKINVAIEKLKISTVQPSVESNKDDLNSVEDKRVTFKNPLENRMEFTFSADTHQHDEPLAHSSPVQCVNLELVKLIRVQKLSLGNLRHDLEKAQTQLDLDNPKEVYEYTAVTINKQWEKICNQNDQIWATQDDAPNGYTIEIFLTMQDWVDTVLIQLSQKLNQLENETNNHNEGIQQTQLGNSIQLPRINIPKFDGNYLRWREFYNLHNEMIHKTHMGAAQKMWLLKSNLCGEAEGLIKHLAVCADNYLSAWNILQQRYNNKRVLVSAILEKLWDQPQCIPENTNSLKRLHDVTKEGLLALQGLGLDTSTWDPMIMHLLIKKLDQPTHSLYEASLTDPRKLPSIHQFLNFIETRFQSLEILGRRQNLKITTTKQLRPTATKQYANTASKISNETKCIMCEGNHAIYACQQFLNLSVNERWDEIKRNKLCCNCLGSGHFAGNCKSRNCPKCQRKHNSLLHTDSKPKKESTVSSANSAIVLSTTNKVIESDEDYVLLGTAAIKVMDINCRALLDSGSQLNFITERFVKKLGIKTKSSKVDIIGIGSMGSHSNRKINIQIQSNLNQYKTHIEAIVLPKITSQQPSTQIDKSSWPIPENLKLCDPSFNQPRSIDLLIGAELYPELMCIGQIRIQKDLPALQNTVFGWMVLGKVKGSHMKKPFCGISTTQLITNLWSLEDVKPCTKLLSADEQKCEDIFNKTTKRDEKGRFIVNLPFASDPSELGNSEQIAIQRFKAIERKLHKNPELKKQYTEFLNEYAELNHMERINRAAIPKTHYFLPHHCVTKLDSSTTKLRVVFDGSAATSNNKSLNDILLTGPTIQDDIFSIWIRFRLPKYVYTADITKMYRQILVAEEHRNMQLIVWRDSPASELSYYRLRTVTYGTTSAPYLAIKCLQRLAEDEAKKYPRAAKVVKQDFYVDDVMSGNNSINSAISIQQELIKMLKGGGFSLRKWSANHPDLLKHIPPQDREIPQDNPEGYCIKTLGLIWNPELDYFHVRSAPFKLQTSITKRIILSDLSQVFDPLGLVNPTTVLAKIFLQEIWKLGVDWDAALPQELHTKWINFRSQLHMLNTIKVPRRAVLDAYKRIELHGFADASEKAYGACIYIRTVDFQGHMNAQLLCAKSRIAPMNTHTIPRLELCAALLLTNLMTQVEVALKIQVNDVYFWSDSSIVLSWISSAASSSCYHTFVANRISAIRETTSATQWNHISTDLNPADIISRGLMPQQLIESQLWFSGPDFLCKKRRHWPILQYDKTETPEEMKSSKSVLTTTINYKELLSNIDHRNSFNTLQRIVAFSLRFITNIRIPAKGRCLEKFPTQYEMKAALQVIVKQMQADNFKDEIKALHKDYTVPKRSMVKALTPFLDINNILRVGGRLQEASLSYDAKHPMILPQKHPITKLIVDQIHWNNMHPGPQALLNLVRQKFWPVRGKQIARDVCQHCFRCFISKPKALQQLMGNLPQHRINPSRPFSYVGIDFAGPIYVHYKIRGKCKTKAYIAVFICFATKAVHLEIVSDLTTAAFLAALTRFTCRRGCPTTIYSDNATNFMGAKAEMEELRQLFYSEELQNATTKTCLNLGIQWSTIPPRSPHFGGLWEAAVKSMKNLLRRELLGASLTYEELETVVTRAEFMLNSRPITPINNDPNDMQPLTPGHFIFLENPSTVQELCMSDQKMNLLKRWELVKRVSQNIWHRWTTGYLHERAKWSDKCENIEQGTLVIMKEDNIPPYEWKMGRIEKTIKGSDGLVRVADVKTSRGIYRRAIHKLCPLPNQETNAQLKTSCKASKLTNTTVHQGKQKQKISIGSLITSILLTTLLILPANGELQRHSIEIEAFKNQPGLYFENIGRVNLIDDEWNLIIFYSLKVYWDEFQGINFYMNQLKTLCSNMTENSIYCHNINARLDHQLEILTQLNNILKPDHLRRKRSPFDFVGTITNKLFGILDQEYATQMETTIKNVQADENHLLKLIQSQTLVIDSTKNLIKKNTQHINTQFLQIKEYLSQFKKKMDEKAALTIYHGLLIQINMIISEYSKMQDCIVDLLLDVHHGKLNPLLLTPDQLRKELHKIQINAAANTRTPNERELRQLYSLINAKGCITSEYLIINIKVPTLLQEHFQIYNVVPLPLRIQHINILIEPSAKYFIINLIRDNFFALTEAEFNECSIHNNIHICRQTSPIYNKQSKLFSCELALFNNDTQNIHLCKYHKETSVHWKWHQLKNSNNCLYSVTGTDIVHIVCGQEVQQRNLHGQGVIKLEGQCTIRQNSFSIKSNTAYTSKIKDLSLLPNVNFTNHVDVNSSSIQELFLYSPLNNSKAIETMERKINELTTEGELNHHDIHQYSLSYTTLGLLVIALIVIIFYIKRYTIQKVKKKTKSTLSREENIEMYQFNPRTN